MFVSKDNPYFGSVFSRGYVVSDKELPCVPEHWKREVFCDYKVAIDPKLRTNILSQHGFGLMLLGTFFDVRYPSVGSELVAENIFSALKEKEASFFSELDYISGRYVVFYCTPGGSFNALTDATGMKSAFYYNREVKIVSSHAKLVAMNGLDARENSIPFKFGYPGVHTPFENVYLLTPNTQLNLRNFSIDRFWPLQSVVSKPIDEASLLVGTYLKNSMDHISKYYDPLVSATAGLDSRVTLSLNKDRKDVSYFTYYRSDDSDSDKLDKEFAQKFSSISGREVDIFRLADESDSDSNFKELQKNNTYANHLKKLSWVYFNRYSKLDRLIHIRSNISEVGREFWGHKKFSINSGADLARLYLRGEKQYFSWYVFSVIRKFNHFANVTGILKCKNYVDVKSLFYWEFRMASWHSQVVVESDPAFETVSLYNCRKVLELLLSVSKENREKSLILRNVISAHWPELTRHRVNGKDFWPE